MSDVFPIRYIPIGWRLAWGVFKMCRSLPAASWLGKWSSRRGNIRVSSKMYPNFANRPLNFTLPSLEVTYMEGTSVSIPDESSGVPARDDLRQRSEVRYKPERV